MTTSEASIKNRYGIEADPWLLCPFCFRVFRESEILKISYEVAETKYCPYQDCQPNRAAYTVHYWSLRLFNHHLPKIPKHEVNYSDNTEIIMPYSMNEKELEERLEMLRQMDELQDLNLKP